MSLEYQWLTVSRTRLMGMTAKSEGKTLAGTPAALWKEPGILSREPSLSCFWVVNKPEITTISYANSNTHCVALPAPGSQI